MQLKMKIETLAAESRRRSIFCGIRDFHAEVKVQKIFPRIPSFTALAPMRAERGAEIAMHELFDSRDVLHYALELCAGHALLPARRATARKTERSETR
jgi:hypothetical protein